MVEIRDIGFLGLLVSFVIYVVMRNICFFLLKGRRWLVVLLFFYELKLRDNIKSLIRYNF